MQINTHTRKYAAQICQQVLQVLGTVGIMDHMLEAKCECLINDKPVSVTEA